MLIKTLSLGNSCDWYKPCLRTERCIKFLLLSLGSSYMCKFYYVFCCLDYLPRKFMECYSDTKLSCRSWVQVVYWLIVCIDSIFPLHSGIWPTWLSETGSNIVFWDHGLNHFLQWQHLGLGLVLSTELVVYLLYNNTALSFSKCPSLND